MPFDRQSEFTALEKMSYQSASAADAVVGPSPDDLWLARPSLYLLPVRKLITLNALRNIFVDVLRLYFHQVDFYCLLDLESAETASMSKFYPNLITLLPSTQ